MVPDIRIGPNSHPFFLQNSIVIVSYTLEIGVKNIA